ncbi:cys-loop ligand gated ion channel-like protein, partial [Leptotrombidium deliense]
MQSVIQRYQFLFKFCLFKYKLGNFSCIVANLKLTRRNGYLHSKYIPSFTIVMASFASFWVPVTSYPARASLVVTSLLALITQQLQITSDIKTSYLVAINIWTNLCTTIVFLCLLE